MTTKYGGVDRAHDHSFGPKLVFALLHGAIVVTCLWLAFGTFEWADPTRAKVLAATAVLYFLRHLVTLFVLLQRKVELSEGLGLNVFIAIFEIGFLLLGAGLLSGEATPFGAWDGLGIALLLVGSYLNTGSELQRRAWKKLPSSNGRCYTGGLFAYSMHINYLGDSILFTGWAILTASLWAFAIPALMTYLFIFYHIPPLDEYLADRYGEKFKTYAQRTVKFLPFVY
jgi:steroid 5-alpha reductase family enzyme